MCSSDDRPIRIAILEADVPIPPISAEYGSYGGVFTSLLRKAADASKIPWGSLELSGWDVVNADRKPEGEEERRGGIYDWRRRRGYPKLDNLDAILITGSRHNSFDNDPWILRLVEYTQQAIAHPHVRIIGVCYGHQIVGRALGARVARHDHGTWEVSVCQVQQTSKGKELFGGKEVLNIHQMHKDIIIDYPPDVDRLGVSGTCQVQGMYRPAKLITVQGHPEFNEKITRELLGFRHKQGIFSDQLFGDAQRRAGDQHDGVVVAQAFLKMLKE